MFGLFVLSRNIDGTFDGRRSLLLLQIDLSSAALGVMQRRTHTDCIHRMKTDEGDLALCIIRRRAVHT